MMASARGFRSVVSSTLRTKAAKNFIISSKLSARISTRRSVSRVAWEQVRKTTNFHWWCGSHQVHLSCRNHRGCTGKYFPTTPSICTKSLVSLVPKGKNSNLLPVFPKRYERYTMILCNPNLGVSARGLAGSAAISLIQDQYWVFIPSKRAPRNTKRVGVPKHPGAREWENTKHALGLSCCR